MKRLFYLGDVKIPRSRTHCKYVEIVCKQFSVLHHPTHGYAIRAKMEWHLITLIHVEDFVFFKTSMMFSNIFEEIYRLYNIKLRNKNMSCQFHEGVKRACSHVALCMDCRLRHSRGCDVCDKPKVIEPEVKGDVSEDNVYVSESADLILAKLNRRISISTEDSEAEIIRHNNELERLRQSVSLLKAQKNSEEERRENELERLRQQLNDLRFEKERDTLLAEAEGFRKCREHFMTMKAKPDFANSVIDRLKYVEPVDLSGAQVLLSPRSLAVAEGEKREVTVKEEETPEVKKITLADQIAQQQNEVEKNVKKTYRKTGKLPIKA